MKPINLRRLALLVPACAAVFSLAAATSPALADNAPFTLTDAPAAMAA
jgi:hypothetical protein